MVYSIKIIDRIGDINVDEWDRLHTEIPFGSLRWVRLALEADPGFKPHFVLLYDDRILVGRAIAAFNKQHGMSITSPVKRALIDGLLDRFPLLQCQGTPYNMVATSGMVLPKGDEVQALRDITQALYGLGRTRSTSFIALGWLNEAEHRALEQVHRYHSQPYRESVLVNCWSNFDEYVMTLGKTARKDFRQHTNHAQKMGIRIESTTQFAKYADQLRKLMANVDYRYQNMGQVIPSNRFFEVAETELAENGHMLLAWVGDTLAGFGYVLHDCGVLKPALLGKDYRFKYVYFEIFYAMLRYGLDNGFKLIRGGVGGAYQFKNSLGFGDRTTYTAYTTPSPLFQWVGEKLSHGVNATTLPESESAEAKQSG